LITPNCVANQKDAGAHSICQKICCSISPTQFKPNLCAEIRLTLFAICPICAPKKASHPVRSKNPREYVDEIDPRFTVLLGNYFVLVVLLIRECFFKY